MRKTLTAFVAALVGLVAVPLALSGRFDSTPAAAASIVPLKVITWNICGEFTGCPKTLTATEMTQKRDAILSLVNAQSADAIMLNETCEWYANTLITLLNKNPDLKDPWQMSFFATRQSDTEASTPSWPGKRTRTCSNSRWAPLIEPDATDQALGVAILTKGAHDQTTAYELPSPTERYTLTAPLLCVRKINGPTVGIPGSDLYEKVARLCIAHFTPPGYDPGEIYRSSQADRVAEIVSSFGNERVIVGGDLNSYPPAGTNGTTPGGTTSPGTSTVLGSLYDLMRECAQPADGSRKGPATTWWGDPNFVYGKLDYLFARSGGGNAASLVTACPAQPATKASQPNSDHAPVVGSFQL